MYISGIDATNQMANTYGEWLFTVQSRLRLSLTCNKQTRHYHICSLMCLKKHRQAEAHLPWLTNSTDKLEDRLCTSALAPHMLAHLFEEKNSPSGWSTSSLTHKLNRETKGDCRCTLRLGLVCSLISLQEQKEKKLDSYAR